MRSSLEYPAVEYSSIVFPYREVSNKLSNFTRTWHFFSQRNIYSCDTYLPILFYSRFVLILTILKNHEKSRNSNFYINKFYTNSILQNSILQFLYKFYINRFLTNFRLIWCIHFEVSLRWPNIRYNFANSEFRLLSKINKNRVAQKKSFNSKRMPNWLYTNSM